MTQGHHSISDGHAGYHAPLMTSSPNPIQMMASGKEHPFVLAEQVKSLQKRLRVTEDRLHLERSDRSVKLCEVEEKLINENANLVVNNRELTVKYEREIERHETYAAKYRNSLRDFEALQMLLEELDSKNRMKLEADWDTMKEKLKREKSAFEKQLMDKTQMLQLKDSAQDAKKSKESTETIYKQKIHDILNEKHNLSSQVKELEDKLASLEVENESLLESIKAAAESSVQNLKVQNIEAQVDSLKNTLKKQSLEVEESNRKNSALESELDKLRTQLSKKGQALSESLLELDTLKKKSQSNELETEQTNYQKKQLNIDIEKLKHQLNEKSEAIRLFKQEEVDQRSHLHNIEEKYFEAKQVLAKKDSQLNELSVTQDNLKEEISQLKRQLSTAQNDISIAMTNLESEKTNNSTLKNQLSSTEGDQINLSNRIHILERENETVKMHLNESVASVQQLKLDNTKLKHEVKDLLMQNEEKERLSESLRQNLEVASKEIKVKDIDVSRGLTDQEYLKIELQELRGKINASEMEIAMLTTTIQSEKESKASLREQCSKEEDINQQLKNKIKMLELEFETKNNFLQEERDLLQKVRQDKELAHNENIRLQQKLASKDKEILKIQEKADKKVEALQRDLHIVQMAKLHEDNDALNRSHGAEEIQEQLQECESELREQKKLKEKMENESARLSDINMSLQGELDRANHSNSLLQNQIRMQQDQHRTEIQSLNQVITENTLKHEAEKAEFHEKMGQTMADLKTTEVTLHTALERKQSIQGKAKNIEHSADELRLQLNHEVVTRKLAEQKYKSLKGQIEERAKQYANMESALSQEQALLLITRSQLLSVEEDNTRLRKQLQKARKRQVTEDEDKPKSRMEEIAEIISRSQIRTQQKMIMAGALNGDHGTLPKTTDLLSTLSTAGALSSAFHVPTAKSNNTRFDDSFDDLDSEH